MHTFKKGDRVRFNENTFPGIATGTEATLIREGNLDHDKYGKSWFLKVDGRRTEIDVYPFRIEPVTDTPVLLANRTDQELADEFRANCDRQREIEAEMVSRGFQRAYGGTIIRKSALNRGKGYTFIRELKEEI
jgi:hypothetical protein